MNGSAFSLEETDDIGFVHQVRPLDGLALVRGREREESTRPRR